MSCSTGCDTLKDRLLQLEQLIYNCSYKTPLTGTEFFLSKAKHKMAQVTNYFVYNKTTGKQVHVEFILMSDQSITIKSNVNLINHILILT